MTTPPLPRLPTHPGPLPDASEGAPVTTPAQGLPAPPRLPTEPQAGAGSPSEAPAANATPAERTSRVIRDGVIYVVAILAVWQLQASGKLDVGSGALIALLAGVRAQGVYDFLMARAGGALSSGRARALVGALAAGGLARGIFRA